MLRIPSLEKSSLFRSIARLEKSFTDEGYAAELYRQVLFLEFMVHLNRAALGNRLEFIDTENSHSKMADILTYINDHLTDELTIDNIADTFFISKFYMMRQFKQETGYTIGKYISRKRLLLAKDLILSGVPSTQACFDCGYKDYSTFSRAYKRLFSESPRETLS